MLTCSILLEKFDGGFFFIYINMPLKADWDLFKFFLFN